MKTVADTVTAHVWFGRLVFSLCAFLLIVLSLVPFNFDASFIPAPDLLFALTFAVLLRRPEFAPFWLILLIFFLSDILQMRPLGLWTAIILVVVEFSRPQEYRFRELALPFEWAYVAGILFLSLLVFRIIMLLAVVPQVRFSTTMLHFLVTALAYPFVVFICHYFLRVRKITPVEATRLGHRL